MASTTPATPGFRNVRDKYLALLLSDVHSQGAGGAAAPTTTPAWTPGEKFPFPSAATGATAPPITPATAAWPSPVTPAPTDADVRLAELTAGLVAAGDNEHRQAEAIRRLTGQLERSERRVRHLEAHHKPAGHQSHPRQRDMDCPECEPQPHSHTHSHAHPPHHLSRSVPHRRRKGSDDDIAPSREHRAAPRSRQDGHRAHSGVSGRPRSTPLPDRREVRKSSSRRPRHSSAIIETSTIIEDDKDENQADNELIRLRRERQQWLRDRERSEKESASLSRMLADIKRNTQRLVRERDDHLEVIARLQDRLSESTRKDSGATSPDRVSNRTPLAAERLSPVKPLSSRQSSPALQDDAPDSSPHAMMFASHNDETVTSSSGDRAVPYPNFAGNQQHTTATTKAVGQSSVHNEREAELQEELQMVLEENARLSQRVPTLETENSRLQNQLRLSEALLQADANHNSGERRRSTDAVLGDLQRLMEEVDILEGVSDAIHFGTRPDSTGCAQSLSRIDLSSSQSSSASQPPRLPQTATGPSTRDNGDSLTDIIKRLARIRSSLSLRYGQWLEAVANQTTALQPQMLNPASRSSRSSRSSRQSHSSRDSTSTPDITPQPMSTKVISRLIDEK